MTITTEKAQRLVERLTHEAEAPQEARYQPYTDHAMRDAAAAIRSLAAERDALLEKNHKFLWQVRDTCTRAERAEAQRDALRVEKVNLCNDLASAERERAHQHDRSERRAVGYAQERGKREALQARVAELAAGKDAAYEERNRVVALLAAVFPSVRARTAIENWSEDWHGCIYITLPTGQASWHYHDSHAHLFAHVPEGAAIWDGHTTPEKYERVAATCAALEGKKE